MLLVARCAIGSVCLAAAPLSAQATRMLSGTVVDSAAGVGISGVDVRLERTTVGAVTDASGQFRIVGELPAGAMLTVRRLGYSPRSVPVPPADVPLRMLLVPSQQFLPAVIVRAERVRYSGRLAGYYERLERHTGGQFITRADLERERPPQLSDMLRRAAGVQMGRSRRSNVESVRMRGRDCAPLIWLDGAAMSVGDVDIDAFSPETIEGIELYLGASGAPARYQASRGKSECGTILLWSRSPEGEAIRAGAPATLGKLESLLQTHDVYSADEVDLPARLDSASLPAIVYPQSLRATGAGGLVVAEFVVDERGHVEREHFNIVASTSPMLEAPVREALRGASFRPASRGGRTVRQIVQLPFRFAVPDP